MKLVMTAILNQEMGEMRHARLNTVLAVPMKMTLVALYVIIYVQTES